MQGQLRFNIRSNFSEARRVQERILDELEQWHYSEGTGFAVRVALEEGLINAIKHGNQYDGKKEVEIEAEVTAERVTIWIRDEGSGKIQRLKFDA